MGSGPFKVHEHHPHARRHTHLLHLRSFSGYALGEPYLSSITLRLYQSEDALADALKSGEVEAASGLSPADLTSIPGINIVRSPLNRVFGVFFNQNQSEVLRDADVREALNVAIDRNDLVNQVLGGYGTPLDGPVPPASLASLGGAIARRRTRPAPTLLGTQQKILADAGWTKAPGRRLRKDDRQRQKRHNRDARSFRSRPAMCPNLRAAAEYLRQQWGRMGAEVTCRYSTRATSRKMSSARASTTRFSLARWWAASSTCSPFGTPASATTRGLTSRCMPTRPPTTLLEQLRANARRRNARRAAIRTFEAELDKDTPAVFLYAPDFVYSIPKRHPGA